MNSISIKNFENASKNKLQKNDFDVSRECIEFKSRPPIFKALMKLEFEKAIREYIK